MYPMALQMWSVRRAAQDDPAATLRQVAQAGYVGIETAGLYGREPAEFRKMIDDAGLSVCAAHVPAPTKENIGELAETAKALGCSMLVSGHKPDFFKTADSIAAVATGFQAAAEALRPHKIKLGYHNHWWEFDHVGGELAMEQLARQMPDVFIELDIYWASNFGKNDVPAFLRKHARRIPLLHVKDGPLVKDQPHTAVGAGKVDVPGTVGAADPKVLQWLIVELDECATDMMQAVRDSANYLVKAGLAKRK